MIPQEKVRFARKLEALAKSIDQFLNGEGPEKTFCFSLIIAEFGAESGVFYLSNGELEGAVAMMQDAVNAGNTELDENRARAKPN